MKLTDWHVVQILDYIRESSDQEKCRCFLIIAAKKIVNEKDMKNIMLDMGYEEIEEIEKKIFI